MIHNDHLPIGTITDEHAKLRLCEYHSYDKRDESLGRNATPDLDTPKVKKMMKAQQQLIERLANMHLSIFTVEKLKAKLDDPTLKEMMPHIGNMNIVRVEDMIPLLKHMDWEPKGREVYATILQLYEGDSEYKLIIEKRILETLGWNYDGLYYGKTPQRNHPGNFISGIVVKQKNQQFRTYRRYSELHYRERILSKNKTGLTPEGMPPKPKRKPGAKSDVKAPKGSLSATGKASANKGSATVVANAAKGTVTAIATGADDNSTLQAEASITMGDCNGEEEVVDPTVARGVVKVITASIDVHGFSGFIAILEGHKSLRCTVSLSNKSTPIKQKEQPLNSFLNEIHGKSTDSVVRDNLSIRFNNTNNKAAAYVPCQKKMDSAPSFPVSFHFWWLVGSSPS